MFWIFGLPLRLARTVSHLGALLLIRVLVLCMDLLGPPVAWARRTFARLALRELVERLNG
jgi:hypothetical protein